MKWQELEKLVRRVAESKFSGTAKAEDIAGVKCDCVIRLEHGHVIVIEISKSDTIEKLRTDISKFNTVRPHFFAQNIFPKCFFITLNDPTPALISAGRENFVTVYSIQQFINSTLGFSDYVAQRKTQAFGSAIDLYSGQPDDRDYIAVDYYTDNGDSYNAIKIAEQLNAGKCIVLIGDYGSGKSRCVKEVFTILAGKFDTYYKQPIAINLRDNWGLKRASEIITRHFTDLGLGGRTDDFLKVAFSPSTIYLLDGFDEIGAQTWSDDPSKLVEIRKRSLIAVKDLINKAQGGILVTGREHYFNNDAELLTCLGLNSRKPLIILRCNQELSDTQFSQLIGGTIDTLPKWIPKKPLIGTIIRDINPQIVQKIITTSSGQVDFWGLLLDTFCERETTINPILDSSIIRSLYTQIGRLSRATNTPLGPISIKAITDAFERTTGRPPTDESAIILQRLPGLSRIGAESLDRQFVDAYILDGLKAEDVLSIYTESDSVISEEWKHPIEDFGAFFLATRIQDSNQLQSIVAYLKRNRAAKNTILLSDILASIFLCDTPIDLAGMTLKKGRFFSLALSDSAVSNLTFDDCHFDSLDITDATPTNITIKDSTIIRALGITSKELAPKWIDNCLFQDFQSTGTLVAIRKAGLSVAQTFLLSSLRKLFLQPGSARKESSMYKGYGDAATKRTCEKVIALLVRNRFCSKFKGDTGDIFVPDRSMTGRVKGIMSQMTQSSDDLWAQVTRIKDS